MKRFFLSAAVLFFALPVMAQDAMYSFPAEMRFVMQAGKQAEVLKQCSRGTPQDIIGYWIPGDADIVALETTLPDYLAKNGHDGFPPRGIYARQYAGIVVGGRKMIYGNFYHPEIDIPDQDKTAMVVCDGGPAFWGIVYDPQAKLFTQLDFNGII